MDDHPNGVGGFMRQDGDVASATGESVASQRGPHGGGILRPFVGRSRELTLLRTAHQRTVEGRAMLAVVSGPSGIGKTALAGRFATAISGNGAIVLSGTCRERDTTGYGAAGALVASLLVWLRQQSPASVQALLPPHWDEFCLLFPEAKSIVKSPASETARPKDTHRTAVRSRAIGAFVEILRRLRTQAPLVLWLDDLQWGDPESAQLLGALFGGPRPVPLFLICGCRSGQDRGPLFESLVTDQCAKLPDAFEIPLGALTRECSVELASLLLPTRGERLHQIAREIGRDARGHPLFIAELTHAACGSWGELQPPDSLSALVTRRLNALPSKARSLLEASAILGEPTTRDLLQEASGLKASEFEAAVACLTTERLLRRDGGQSRKHFDVHHDRVRDIVVEALGILERRRLHEVWANKLARLDDTTPEVLAFHWLKAGESARAARHWLAAGEQAFQALAFNRAADFYDRCLGALPESSDPMWTLRKRRAESLALAGRGQTAADEYLVAAQQAPSEDALEMTCLAAEQLLFSGYVDGGLALTESVRDQLGIPRTNGGRLAVLSLLRERLRLRRRGFGTVPRKSSELTRSERVRLNASWSIACSLGAIDPIRGAEYQSKHLVLALDTGEPKRVLRAITIECCYQAHAGLRTASRTKSLLQLADSLAETTDDSDAVGLLKMIHGLVAYLQGDLKLALWELFEAEAVLSSRSPNAIWELVTIRRFLTASLFFLGQWRRLADFVPPLLESSVETGNRYALMSFRTSYAWAGWVAVDNIVEARRQLAQAKSEWSSRLYMLPQCNFLIGESYLDLYEGRATSALARFESHWPKVCKSRLLRIGVVQVQVLQLHAGILIQSASQHERNGEVATALAERRKARRIAARIASEQRLLRAAPIASLLHAALDFTEGSVPSAVAHLQSAAEKFDNLGMNLWAAAARMRWSESVAGEEGASLRARALEVFEREKVVSPQKVIRMLAPGLENFT